ncbi:MAG: rRNA pseudouridine synthase, partial [Chloroflexota bacterium]
KILAAAGVASRRAAETLIRAGRVRVNGQVMRELGTRADPARDTITVDGQRIAWPPVYRYFLLHKPPGYTSTVHDPHAKRTVLELLPKDTGRVYPVGRLDRNSEGLLLLTNDGDLAQRLMHPRYHLPKEYAVLVRGQLSERTLEELRRAIVIEGKTATPAEVEPGEPPRFLARSPEELRRTALRGTGASGDTLWLRFVLYEGRKRQIRALCARAGLEILRLVRIRMGPLTLGRLAPGKARPLTLEEITHLRRAAGLEVARPTWEPGTERTHPRHGGRTTPRTVEAGPVPDQRRARSRQRQGFRRRPRRG